MNAGNLLRKAEIFLGVAVVIGAVMSLWVAAERISLPYQIDYAEGIVLDAAQRLTEGDTPYPAPGESPDIINQYGPFFYSLVATVVKTSGLGFGFPRLLVVLSGLAIVALLVWLLRQRTGSMQMGLTFGGLYLCLVVVRAWLPILRPDLIGIALSLAGLVLFSRRPDRWYLAIPLFLAALFTKHTLLAAPAACFLFLAIRKEWKKAAWFAGSLALPGAVLFVLLEAKTGGGFSFHMIGSHAAPLSLTRYGELMGLTLVFHLLLVFLALVLALRELSDRKPSLPLLYLLASSAATLTLAKVGADLNHLLEWLAALCLVAGLGYHRLRWRPEEAATATFAAVALAMFVLATLPVGTGPLEDRAECDELYAYVQNHSAGHVLSENAGALVMGGKQVLVSDPFAYGQLVRHGDWPSAPLNERLRSKYFGLILTDGELEELKTRAADPMSSGSRWPRSFVESLGQNYAPVRRFACKEAAVAFEPVRRAE